MAERFYWLIAGTLAVWRVTHLLAAEDGPARILVRLRRAAGDGFWGTLLDCFQCLSLWVAAPAAVLLGKDWLESIALWLAWSGGAILLDRAAAGGPAAEAFYYEGGTPDAVLRRSENAGADGRATGA